MAERIRVFDRALGAMLRFQPDLILIACNTLSALYAHTPFSKQAPVPVVGIIDFGVDLMHAYLSARGDSRVIILGTPTTIEADTHRTRLVERGIDAERIVCQPCDRLAGEIEKDPEGATVRAMVESCIRQAAERVPDRRGPVAGRPVLHALRVQSARLRGRPAVRIRGPDHDSQPQQGNE